jgi:hypothetical protein
MREVTLIVGSPISVPAVASAPRTVEHPVHAASGDVDVALGDGQGGAWGSALDPAPNAIESAIRACYEPALRDRPAIRGWAEGPVEAVGGSGHFTLTLHVARQYGLPPELVQCIEDAGRRLVVDMDTGMPLQLSFYASFD